MSSTIIFDAVTKLYPAGRGAGPGSPAVDSFSARIEAGTTTVLLGSSGCGKTTLLRMVNRMVEPSSGRVLIDDEDIATRDAVALRRSIGYVMQNAGLLPHRRVIDNITLVPRLQGTNRRDARQRALELMDLLDLDRDLAGRYPHQLSGGQAQRVGVELDKTIIFVTHDVDEALALGDEIILLREGAQIAQRGSGAELLADPADDFVARFLGLDDAARQLRLKDVAETRIVLDRAGRVVGRLSEESVLEAEGQA